MRLWEGVINIPCDTNFLQSSDNMEFVVTGHDLSIKQNTGSMVNQPRYKYDSLGPSGAVTFVPAFTGTGVTLNSLYSANMETFYPEGNILFYKNNQLPVTGIAPDGSASATLDINGDVFTSNLPDTIDIGTSPNTVAAAAGATQLFSKDRVNFGRNNFVGLSGQPRTSYGHYGEYYLINADVTWNGGTQRSLITIDPGLEAAMPENTQIKGYSQRHPSNLFRFDNVDLQDGLNTLTVNVRDALGNPGTGASAVASIFVDMQTPQISLKQPSQPILGDNKVTIRYEITDAVLDYQDIPSTSLKSATFSLTHNGDLIHSDTDLTTSLGSLV
ncbi:MAG: hypothetical protein QF535_10030, partial [Anaerolineales bacterium]|nr:hypothetical protein [Anaerolineales bacterium]